MKPVIDLEKEYGLVLEGGGAKGAYQIGAWKALREAGIRIRGVAGTSVGALNGALICMDDMERAENLWKTITYSKVMDVDDEQMKNLFRKNLEPEMLREVLKDTLHILRDGGTDITPLRNLIDENIDAEKIHNSPMEFYSCTFSVADRQELTMDMRTLPEGQMKDMLIASSYLPVFKNVKMGGKTYLDGGVANVLPVDTLLERGYKDIILLRIFGIGWEKRVDIPEDVNIYEIAPRVPLGNILQFDAARSRRNMRVGYYDALRWLYGLKGKTYYVEQSHGECYYLTRLLETDPAMQLAVLENYKLAENPDQRIRSLVEIVFPLMADELKLSRDWTYRELYLTMLEETARAYRIPRYRVYTEEELLALVKQKAGSTDLPEDAPDYMRFIL